MHIYIHTCRVTYATNFTPGCLPAMSLLYLPSKLSEAVHRHLGMNELLTRLPENPRRQGVSLNCLQYICFGIFLLWVRDITQHRLDEKLKDSTKNIHCP